MSPKRLPSSRLPTSLRFLLMCEGLPIDTIYQHFEDQLGGLLPARELRAAVRRLVRDAVSAGTLRVRGGHYSVSSTALPERTPRQYVAATPRRRHRRPRRNRRQPSQEADVLYVRIQDADDQGDDVEDDDVEEDDDEEDDVEVDDVEEDDVEEDDVEEDDDEEDDVEEDDDEEDDVEEDDVEVDDVEEDDVEEDDVDEVATVSSSANVDGNDGKNDNNSPDDSLK